MVSDAHQILKDVKDALLPAGEADRLKPADSLLGDAIIKTILAWPEAEKSGITATDEKTRFYVFLLTVNKHFDLKTNKPERGSEHYLESVADTLSISRRDYDLVMEFYDCNVPYTDQADAVYIAFEKANRLVRSKGVHVYFTNQIPGQIVYLKYVESYDLFLSKTFIPTRTHHSIREEVRSKDLNIITEQNYAKQNYGTPNFSELKDQLKHFNPLQHIEVSETSYLPRITLDPEKGAIRISGSSSPISSTAFFDPVFEWLNLFDLSGNNTLNVYFHFKYCNTYTTKFLVNFVWKCNALLKKDKTVGFYWYYDPEDDDMRDFGEYLASRFNEKNTFYLLGNVNSPQL